jgi:signal transduction histidine kinase
MDAPATSYSARQPTPGALLVAVAAAGLAVGGALLALGLTSDHLELPGLVLPLLLVVGWSFVGVGLYAWWRRPENRFGALMVLAGFAWFIAGLQVSDIPLVFTLGVWLSFLYLAAIVHLLLAFPSGRLEDETDRGLVIGVYAVATVLLLPAILLLDFESDGCEECPRNAFLVSESQAAFDVFDVVTSLLGLLLVLEVARSLWRRWRAAGARARRALTPVLAAGGFATVALGINFAFDVLGVEPMAELAGLASLIGIAAVPWSFLLGLARSAVTRGGAVGDLVADLGAAPHPEQVREALAQALADPGLELAYWIPETETYVDAAGREVRPPEDGSREVTPVELAGYAAARRLERDLHDGAQQRLVSLAPALRLVEPKIGEDPAEATRRLVAAREELGQAIDELRDFARGLHPGMLTTRGLDAAVEALASRAPLPVEVRSRVGERLPEQVEAAAYFVVSEALTNVARYADAGSAWVGLARRNGVLDVEVGDDCRGGADPAAGSGLRGLRDRVSALDGRLEVDSPPGAGTRVHAHIPCG